MRLIDSPEFSQTFHAWGKEVLAASQPYVFAKCESIVVSGSVTFWPIRAVVRFPRTAGLTDHGIDTGSALAEIMIVGPSALYEFELVLDVGLVADENQTDFTRPFSVGDSAPGDASFLFSCE